MENYFAKNLKHLRTQHKYTLEQLAEKLTKQTDIDVKTSTIGHWETGARTPKIDTVVKIAKFFNVGEDMILKDLTIDNQHTQFDKDNLDALEYLFYQSQNKEKLTKILQTTKNMDKEEIDKLWDIVQSVFKNYHNKN